MRIWNFNFNLKINLFWKWYVLMVIINRWETLKRHGDVFLYISQNFKLFGNVEKKFEIILCLGPNLKLIPKFVKISHLTKMEWFKNLKIESKHVLRCYNQFLHIQIDMWTVEVWEVIVGNLRQKGFLNKSLEVEQSQKDCKGMDSELVE
jgi:hypothetical protein